MKTFDQLTAAEKVTAFNNSLERLLGLVTEGAIRFNDGLNGDGLQARIDAAWKKAEAMRTPWFAHEYIMDTCKDDLEAMARADAEDALYSEPAEHVIAGVAE